MKSVAVLAVICCLIVGETFSSPVPKVPSNEGTKTANALDLSEATGRQAVGGVAQPAAPAAASDDDDDDDDDEEDDDLDLEDLTDDDDDDDDDDDEDEPKPAGAPSSDDDDDDDDEDDDYLERFIDDILGGDEDDDDDDETVSVVEPIAPAAPAQAQVVQPLVSAAPSIPAAVQSDLNALADGTGEEVGNVAENAPIEAESGSYEDDEVSDITPEGQAASSLAETGNPIEGEGIPVVLTSQSSPSGILQQASGGTSSDDDDDDDDDEDDDSLDIPEITDDDEDEDDEDDDEDDEDDEDDDDDDDDDGIPDIDARRARAMDTEPPNTHVPAIYVAKYNRFVDNILGRINKILRDNYDPVTVKLTNPTSSSKSKTKSSTKKKSKKTGTKKHGSKKSAFDAAAGGNVIQVNKATTNVSTTQKTEADDLKNVATTVAVETLSNSVPNAVATTPRIIETTKAQEPAESRASTNTKKQKKKRTKTKSKNKTKNTISTNTSTGDKNKTKVKKQSKPKARAILYGLSSLKRTGDVSVNMMRDHTTIKTKFGLGPLILKVEKEFGRAAKKELRSATATTAEMSGRLSLRVLHGGAATLHSIRVLQPKQVRVESADDHDRTREFVWRRSSHIAHLVSQKLSTATRSMLRPPPISVTAV